MKAVELKKAFNPADYEQKIYKFWIDNKLFSPNKDRNKKPYVIVIPPPNVTGVLHVGHGLDNSLQDILIRYHRMLGQPTLWIPGTDHAGIATQNVVEKKLKDRGISKNDIGRERFIDETWKVKKEHHGIITEQLKRLGASCDWDRERFTLDAGLSRAVREVFVSLYEKGLIYKGNYLINWCPSCGTAISDDEVEHEEIKGKMYHYYYPLADGTGRIPIATTRPETMLGDTAVAVHPDDRRYKNLIGKMAALPLTGRKIPVIADSYVDKEFGSGAVKVTPAHDPNDYEIGIRHSLEKINIINPDGTLNKNVPPRYSGLTIKEARKKVIEDLKEEGLFIKEEDHVHQVGHCYRCHTVIEPYLSNQWFVKMKPLAEQALKAWEHGKVKFFPKKWENTYTHWLNNIRDWCISRQLWWGHRIPVWYCSTCNKMTVSRTDPDTCIHCGSADIYQDPDVLDTWFSSALWPFSTLGWPEKTKDLEFFYPTSTLVTGYDIIFFWVARMIMMGMEFMKEVPFKDVYIHGLIRDKQGRKMSKSLGNGIDPIEIVDEYGADAFKFTTAFLSVQGKDILMDKESFKMGSKFANKIWNASRFILMNLEGRKLVDKSEITYTDEDLWIFHRINKAAETVETALKTYRFNDAAQAVYEYFWNDYCDWFLEISKLSLYSGSPSEQDRIITVLISLLEESLRLLHPFLPFITEEIYQKLPVHLPNIIRAPYPEYSGERSKPEIEKNFSYIQELVRAVRTVRSEFTIPREKKIHVAVKAEKNSSVLNTFRQKADIISLLINASRLDISDTITAEETHIPAIGTGFEAFVYTQELVNIPKEVERLKKEKQKVERETSRTKGKLENSSFLEKAPLDVVNKEREKLLRLKETGKKIDRFLANLSA
ncbi:MAG: valine--tRNA ligase [Spirochaetes bacterium]|nr:valine--tRNA ligase [Spirochaetota bacterium]